LLHRNQGNRQTAGAFRSGTRQVYGSRPCTAEDHQNCGHVARKRAYQPAFIRSFSDGKYLYQFGAKMTILQTSDFKVVDQLDLAQPDFSVMENGRLENDLDLISQPGVHTSIFNASDPIVHNRVFGLARLDLGKRQVSYKPIGPAPGAMAGLQVTPDKKL